MWVSIVLGDQESLSGGVERSAWGQDQEWARSQPGSNFALLMTSVPLSSTGGGWPIRPSWTPRIPWGPWSTGKRLPLGISFWESEDSGCGAEGGSMNV